MNNQQTQTILTFFNFLLEIFQSSEESFQSTIEKERKKIAKFPDYFTSKITEGFDTCLDETNNLSDTMIDLIFDKWLKLGVPLNIKMYRKEGKKMGRKMFKEAIRTTFIDFGCFIVEYITSENWMKVLSIVVCNEKLQFDKGIDPLNVWPIFSRDISSKIYKVNIPFIEDWTIGVKEKKGIKKLLKSLGLKRAEFVSNVVYCYAPHTIKKNNGRQLHVIHVPVELITDFVNNVKYKYVDCGEKHGQQRFLIYSKHFTDKNKFCFGECLTFKTRASFASFSQENKDCVMCTDCFVKMCQSNPSTSFSCQDERCGGKCQHKYTATKSGVVTNWTPHPTKKIKNEIWEEQCIPMIQNLVNTENDDSKRPTFQGLMRFYLFCPSCYTNIQHSGGCNSVTCTCGYTFCIVCGGNTHNKLGECDCGIPRGYREDNAQHLRNGFLWEFENQLDCDIKQPTVFTNLEARFPHFLKCLSYYNDVARKMQIRPLSKEDVIRMGRIIMADTEDYMEHKNLMDVLGEHAEYVPTSVVFTLALFLYSYSYDYQNKHSFQPVNVFGINKNLLGDGLWNNFPEDLKSILNINADHLSFCSYLTTRNQDSWFIVPNYVLDPPFEEYKVSEEFLAD